ncbi:MAG: TolC family protein [Bacteroidota bacterium]
MPKAVQNALFLLCCFVNGVFAQGQSTVLSAYVQEGLEKNLTTQKIQLGIDKQFSKVAEAKGNKLPTVTFEPNYLLAAGGRRLAFPIGDLFNPAYGALNQLTQTQDFPTNLENVDEQLTPSNFHDTRFYANYPLFNPAIYYNIKAQEQLISVEEAKLAAQQAELTKEIKVAYYNYFKTFEVLKILDESQNLLNDLYRFNQKLVKYDKATEDILAGVTFDLENINSQRAGVLEQQIMAKAYFNALLQRDYDAPIEAEPTPLFSNTNSSTVANLQQTAVKNRAELQQLKEAQLANQITVTLQEKSLLPTVGLQATAGLQGFGYSFDSEQFLGTLAIGAKWTIFDGKIRKRKIEQQVITNLELQKDYEIVQQQIELQVMGAFHALNTAIQKVRAEKVAVESAANRMNIIRKRYENEKALLIEFLDAQNKWTIAKINLSTAQFDVLIRRVELERAVAE